MKKNILAIALLSAVSSSAYGTTARLLALGMDEKDNEGSYYINDDRNIFLNAAYVNLHKNKVILEYGSIGNIYTTRGNGVDNNGDETSNTAVDKNFAPKAKGGILYEMGDSVLGVYLGNESNTSALLKVLATAPAAAYGTGVANGEYLNTSDNQLDLFYGWKTGSINWGANAVYTSSEDETNNAKDHGYAVRFGALAENWDAFLNLGIGSKSKKTVSSSLMSATVGQDLTMEFVGKLGFHVGGSVSVLGGKFFGYYKQFDWEQKDSYGAFDPTADATINATLNALGKTYLLSSRGTLGTIDGSFSSYTFGYGHEMEVEQGKIWTSIAVRQNKVDVEYSTKASAENFWIPLTIAYEAQATDWLVLRGSIIQYLSGFKKNSNYSQLNPGAYGSAVDQFGADTNGKKSDFANSTDVRAGASLVFGDVSIDGLIGVVVAYDPTSATLAAGTEKDNGTLRLDELMSRVAMTYKF